ncbi:MAG: hypothetical protein O3A00_24225, partial [Planctomycetota bacterium]|nr:hypothetical protein [Planctomycetota bacterium]
MPTAINSVRIFCWGMLSVALSAPWWCERPWLLRFCAVPMIVWAAWRVSLNRSLLVATLTGAFGTFR